MRSNRSREGGCNHIPSFMDIGRGMCVDLSLVMGISLSGQTRDGSTLYGDTITIYFTTGTTMIFKWKRPEGSASVHPLDKCNEIRDRLKEYEMRCREEYKKINLQKKIIFFILFFFTYFIIFIK